MNATASAIESETGGLPPSKAVRPHVVPTRDVADSARVEEARAEGAVFRDAILGAIIGVIVCVPLWVGLVLIALRDANTALLPLAAMAAGVGVLAGIFVGGWAGTLVGSTTLEQFEREHRPVRRPER